MVAPARRITDGRTEGRTTRIHDAYYCSHKNSCFVSLQLESLTYSGTVRQSYGGVGRNIADCLSRLGVVPLFVSRVGRDVAGQAFIDQFKHMVSWR